MYKYFFALVAVIFLGVVSCQDIQAQGGQPGWQGTAGSPSHFLSEVAKGNIPGHSLIHKFGHGTVGTSMVPITTSLVYQTPITAVALEIVSSDADDTAAGAGARTVYIEGLNLAGDIVSQTVALNGLTAVAIPTPLWRLYRWYVATTGVYGTTAVGSHQGTITIRVAAAGATWSTIQFAPYPAGQSEIGWYTIPNNHRGYVYTKVVKVDSTKSVDVLFMQRPGADTVVAPFTPFRLVEEFIGVAGAGSGISTYSPLGVFPEMTDIGWLGKIGTGTADISVDFEILLVKDGY